MAEDIWTELLNSDWHDHLGSGRREDRLDNPQWLDRYLASHGMDPADIPPEELARSLGGLRTLLRRIVDSHVARKPVSPAYWEALNLVLARAPLARRIEIPAKGSRSRKNGNNSNRSVSASKNPRPRFSATSSPRLILVPAAGRLESFLAEIVQSFVQSFSGDGEARVNICHNPDCLWVFYDRSKNRSRRWCEDTCGNLMKVRRFRKKRRLHA